MKIITRRPSHPGGILRRLYLEPLALSVTKLASALKTSRKTISKLVNERGSITPDMALRLSVAFKTTPELWLNMQNNFDLWFTSHESREWAEVEKLAA